MTSRVDVTYPPRRTQPFNVKILVVARQEGRKKNCDEVETEKVDLGAEDDDRFRIVTQTNENRNELYRYFSAR